MELRQLRAVLAIAETGSVTKAADLLHVVQPAISRQIRLLESELGKPIFVRNHSGMQLTEEGKVLVQHARRAILALDQASAEIRPAQDVVSGLVTVGLLPSICDVVAGALLTAVQREYPHIRLRFSAGYAGQLQEWLDQGVTDIGIFYDPQLREGHESTPLLSEPFYLVGRPGGTLRLEGPQPLSVLADLPLILPSSAHSVRGILEHACVVDKIPLNVAAEADDFFLLRALVAAGAGYSVLAGIAIAEGLRAGQLVAAPLGVPPIKRRLSLALSGARRTSRPVRCVSTILYDRVQALVQSGVWPGAQAIPL